MKPRIPQSFVDLLLSSVDIADIVGSRISVDSNQNPIVAQCPFHDDKGQNLVVNSDDQSYSCALCDVRGSAIGFVMYFDNLHFVDALANLASTADIDMSDYLAEDILERPVTEQLNSLEKAASSYEAILDNTPLALDYLGKRGITKATAKRYRLGYAPFERNHLEEHFSISLSKLARSGLCGRNKDNTYFPRFRNRIVFPVLSDDLAVVGFGARSIDAQNPKYLNSPSTQLFNKNQLLYRSIDSDASDNVSCLIVEGYIDVIKLSQAGITNVYSPMGTALNSAHLKTLLNRYTNVVLCFDGDNAGVSSIMRIIGNLSSLDLTVNTIKIVSLPPGHDPDSFIDSHGVDSFSSKLNNSIDFVRFALQTLQDTMPTSTIGEKAAFSAAVKALFSGFSNSEIRFSVTNALSEIIGIDVLDDYLDQ